jgi:hypothetical protein
MHAVCRYDLNTLDAIIQGRFSQGHLDAALFAILLRASERGIDIAAQRALDITNWDWLVTIQ